MSYALVISNVVQSESTVLPASARRLDTQEWVLGLPDASAALRQACGYYPVTDVAQPADTPTKTYDRTVTLVGGVPTVTWTQRDKTAAEIAGATADANSATLRAQAQGALATNTTYLALGIPTNAQVAAQVRALTQQNSALIRLALGLFDATS